MSKPSNYLRVIPRDLFNEGNLLKCYGQLYLNLEREGLENALFHDDDTGPFQVEQSSDDGSLSLRNVTLMLRGMPVRLRRPLNARSAYPLWASMTEDGEEVAVFNDDGTFTDDMQFLLLAGAVA